MYKIGVFDSGIGGKSVANAISQALPTARVLFVDDPQNFPYGSKSPAELYDLVCPILQDLAKEVDAIVVACNTVSTTLITRLRKQIPVPLIAMEPMVKPAAQVTKTGMVAICATPATLASERYIWLKKTYAKDITVLEPDCSDWALMIENKQVDRHKIFAQVDEACKMGADVIVLGCTHYHWIEEMIKETVGDRAQVLQPELPVIEQLKRVLKNQAQ